MLKDLNPFEKLDIVNMKKSLGQTKAQLSVRGQS